MNPNTKRIVLGGGCFWCLEAVFKRISGVTSTRPGYAGGSAENPDYAQICTGETGHAEVVEISFDPEIISTEALLEIFWRAHDPTTLNRQGEDVGHQYRSIILYADENQKHTAEVSLAGLVESGMFSDMPVTAIEALGTFWPAEAYHKDYFEGHRTKGYCRLVIEPKLHKLALLED